MNLDLIFWFWWDDRIWFHSFGNPHAVVYFLGIEWSQLNGSSHPTVSRHGLN